MRRQFKIVACGGTFDRFHKGHQKFLRFAFSKGKKVVIGLTTDKFIQNKKEQIELYSKRKLALEGFLKLEGFQDKSEIIPINDVFGPTLLPSFRAEAIVVSKQTKKGAELINLKRKGKGLLPFYILIVPQVLAEGGGLISSSRIRNGEINREGRLYVQLQWLRHPSFLPEELRSVLRKPFGRLIKNTEQLRDIESNARVITVGDITTREFNRLGIKPKICVVDFKVARKKKFKSLNELGFEGVQGVLKVKNYSGSLTPALFKVVQKAIQLVNSKQQTRIILKVNGEEDLAVLPCLLSSPLGWTIFYGQPEEGVVEVKVMQESKERAYKLVGRFSPRLAQY